MKKTLFCLVLIASTTLFGNKVFGQLPTCFTDSVRVDTNLIATIYFHGDGNGFSTDAWSEFHHNSSMNIIGFTNVGYNGFSLSNTITLNSNYANIYTICRSQNMFGVSTNTDTIFFGPNPGLYLPVGQIVNPIPPTITMLNVSGGILSANVTDTVFLQSGHSGKILEYFRLTANGPMFFSGSMNISSTGSYSVIHSSLPAGTIFLRDMIVDLVLNDTITNNQLAVTILPQPISCSVTHVSTTPTLDGGVEMLNLNSGLTTMSVTPVVYLPFNNYTVAYPQTAFTYNGVGGYTYTFTGYPTGYTFKYKFLYSNSVNSDSTNLITITTNTSPTAAWTSGIDSFSTPARTDSIGINFRTNVYGVAGICTVKYGPSGGALNDSIVIALPASFGDQNQMIWLHNSSVIVPSTSYDVMICVENGIGSPYCSAVSSTTTATNPTNFAIVTISASYDASAFHAEKINGIVYVPAGTIGYPNFILATDSLFSNAVIGSAQSLPTVSVSGTSVSVTISNLVEGMDYYAKFYGPCSNGQSSDGNTVHFTFALPTGVEEFNESKESSFLVYDLTGRLVLKGDGLKKGEIPNLNNIPSGLYILKSDFETKKIEIFNH